MKAVFILCDSVSRRLLQMYGSAEPAITPNLDRLAERSVVFDNHWCGSAPCMPARKDILTGRFSFLEKSWGGMEPYDHALPDILRTSNVHCQLFSDHSNYLIPGGENYTKGFTAWQVERGQECDPVWQRPGPDGIKTGKAPAGYKGGWSEAEEENRRHLLTEYDYPSVRTIRNASQWLEENADADNFLLWVEAFDPHEPYDCPLHYLELYEKPGEYTGVDWTHPGYEENVYDEAETRHLRNRCKALLTMVDRYLGGLFDVLDQHDMWKDTMVIFTTDHGFHLGEHGFMAKNYMPPYNEVFHLPMTIAAPGVTPGHSPAITQAIDFLPTLMDYFGVSESVPQNKLHGRNLLPVLRREKEGVRESTIFGYFGKQVGWTDGRYTYFRAAKDESNRPLNVYTAIPTMLRQFYGANEAVNVEDYDKIEMGRFLPWTKYPVYKIPADIIHLGNASLDFSVRSTYIKDNLLFDLREDYSQQNPITDPVLEAEIIKRLKKDMEACDALPEQFERLGL